MLISVKVHSNSRPQRLAKISEDDYEVYLKSPPENNKANEELIKLLQKQFKGLSVNLIRGKTSRKKVIKIGN